MTAALIVAVALAVVAIPLRSRRGRVVPGAASRPRADRLALAVGGIARSRPHPTPDARAVAVWCDDLGRRVRSGSTLRQALAEAPTDIATARVTSSLRSAIDRGLSVPDAAARVGDAGPHLQLALAVITTTSRIGGPAAASIDRTAMVLRQRAAQRDERSTQAAQARLSTHVMTAVPLLMLTLLVATDDDVRSVVTSLIGATCIAAGLILNVVGWWWMHRIVGTPT